MTVRYITWEDIVLRILGDHYPREVDLQTIYAEVGKHTERARFLRRNRKATLEDK